MKISSLEKDIQFADISLINRFWRLNFLLGDIIMIISYVQLIWKQVTRKRKLGI